MQAIRKEVNRQQSTLGWCSDKPTDVSRRAVAGHVARAGIQVAAGGVVHPAVNGAGARARATRNVHTVPRVAVEAGLAPACNSRSQWRWHLKNNFAKSMTQHTPAFYRLTYTSCFPLLLAHLFFHTLPFFQQFSNKGVDFVPLMQALPTEFIVVLLTDNMFLPCDDL